MNKAGLSGHANQTLWRLAEARLLFYFFTLVTGIIWVPQYPLIPARIQQKLQSFPQSVMPFCFPLSARRSSLFLKLLADDRAVTSQTDQPIGRTVWSAAAAALSYVHNKNCHLPPVRKYMDSVKSSRRRRRSSANILNLIGLVRNGFKARSLHEVLSAAWPSLRHRPCLLR